MDAFFLQAAPKVNVPIEIADCEKESLSRVERQVQTILSDYETKCLKMQADLRNGVDEYTRAYAEVKEIFKKLGTEYDPQAVKRMEVELATRNRELLALQRELEAMRDLVDPFARSPQVKYIKRLTECDEIAFDSLALQFETWANDEPVIERRAIMIRAQQLCELISGEYLAPLRHWAEGELTHAS